MEGMKDVPFLAIVQWGLVKEDALLEPLVWPALEKMGALTFVTVLLSRCQKNLCCPSKTDTARVYNN